MRRKKPAEHANHERWLVSYADFITLLFAFFTTMYAISTVDAQKMGKMVMSMRASFDNTVFTPGSETLAISQGPGGVTRIVENVHVPQKTDVLEYALHEKLNSELSPHSDASSVNNLSDLKKTIEMLVGAEALKKKVRTNLDARGLVVSLREVGVFDSGSDEIKPDGRALLDTIATTLASTGNHIRIEGHTDDVPIRNSRFASNWELSTSRATAIVSYLITRFRMSPEKLSAAGYAEFRPVASNESAEGRAKNRRVDIVVLNARYAESEPR